MSNSIGVSFDVKYCSLELRRDLQFVANALASEILSIKKVIHCGWNNCATLTQEEILLPPVVVRVHALQKL